MAAADLCTLEDVRLFLGKDDSDTSQDAVIASLISRASLAIMRDCQREFAPASSSAARVFRYSTPGRMSLAPYEARTVTNVRMDSDQASPVTLTASQYRLWPVPAPDGTYLTLLFDGTEGSSASAWRDRVVEVTGTWGMAAVPEDVRHACVVTAATWFRRDVAAFSTTFKLDEDRVERPEVLPAQVRGLLDRYRRHEYA